MPAPRTHPARRYAGKDADLRADERRERLLDAGLQIFGTQGFASSSIEGICAQARVSTRTFYELFGRKERLILDVDARIVERTASRITATSPRRRTRYPSASPPACVPTPMASSPTRGPLASISSRCSQSSPTPAATVA